MRRRMRLARDRYSIPMLDQACVNRTEYVDGAFNVLSWQCVEQPARSYQSKTARSCRESIETVPCCVLNAPICSNHVTTKIFAHDTRLTTSRLPTPTPCASHAPNSHRSSSHLCLTTNGNPRNQMYDFDKRSKSDHRKTCYHEKKAEHDTVDKMA